LGLAIVHAIVDAHRGRIDVDSRQGEGTTFTILLPHPTVSLTEQEQAVEWNGMQGSLPADEQAGMDIDVMEERAHE
jgi:chemotaxis protein histidine kinase CheA